MLTIPCFEVHLRLLRRLAHISSLVTKYLEFFLIFLALLRALQTPVIITTVDVSFLAENFPTACFALHIIAIRAGRAYIIVAFFALVEFISLINLLFAFVALCSVVFLIRHQFVIFWAGQGSVYLSSVFVFLSVWLWLLIFGVIESTIYKNEIGQFDLLLYLYGL